MNVQSGIRARPLRAAQRAKRAESEQVVPEASGATGSGGGDQGGVARDEPLRRRGSSRREAEGPSGPRSERSERSLNRSCRRRAAPANRTHPWGARRAHTTSVRSDHADRTHPRGARRAHTTSVRSGHADRTHPRGARRAHTTSVRSDHADRTHPPGARRAHTTSVRSGHADRTHPPGARRAHPTSLRSVARCSFSRSWPGTGIRRDPRWMRSTPRNRIQRRELAELPPDGCDRPRRVASNAVRSESSPRMDAINPAESHPTP